MLKLVLGPVSMLALPPDGNHRCSPDAISLEHLDDVLQLLELDFRELGLEAQHALDFGPIQVDRHFCCQLLHSLNPISIQKARYAPGYILVKLTFTSEGTTRLAFGGLGAVPVHRSPAQRRLGTQELVTPLWKYRLVTRPRCRSST